MGTIEQAAKRLEQLKQSGIETEMAAVGGHGAAESLPESVPLRVAKELESRGATTVRAEPHLVVADEPQRIEREPLTAGAKVEIDLAQLSANGYLTPDAERSRIAEEFRVIKRPLLNNATGKAAAPVRNANRIMVTSALPGEGKTFVSLNLAMSLATEFDTEVLLVDADATRPALLQRLGLPPSKGLLDVLADPRLPVESVVMRTNVDRLLVLPAGAPHAHSTELLASESMSRLVARLAADPRRIVVFDTPPLLVASESRVLAAHMGQVIMVIAADDTPQGTVAEGLSTVENCPVVFTLLNRVSSSDRGHYYGSYSAYAH